MGSKWHDWSRYDSTIRKMHRDGKTYTEIAKHLGLPEGTIYEHCRGALGFKLVDSITDDEILCLLEQGYTFYEAGRQLGKSVGFVNNRRRLDKNFKKLSDEASAFGKEKDMIEEKLVYSVAEVVQLLGVSLTKVYDLTNRSDFPVVQVGRRKLIPKKEFEEWLSRETKHTRT